VRGRGPSGAPATRGSRGEGGGRAAASGGAVPRAPPSALRGGEKISFVS
jgi:hypothetical protein